MKRIIILICLLCNFMAFSITAQEYIVVRNRPEIEPNTTHLTFENIPIDGEVNQFWKNMEKNGYTVKCQDQYCFNKFTEKDIAGIKNWEIKACSEGMDEEYVYAVTMTQKFNNREEQLDGYKKIKEYIKIRYPITNTVMYIADNSYDGKDTETHYMIAGKGRIVINYYSTKEGLFVRVTFYDKENENTIAIQPVRDYYEIKSNSDIYEQCIIEIAGYNAKFLVKSKNNTYRFLTGHEDGFMITMLLTDEKSVYDDKMKSLLINSYILKGLEKCRKNEFIPIIDKEFLGICNTYMIKAKQLRKQTYRKPVNFKDIVLEEVRKIIFSPGERDILDKIIPPEMMRDLINSSINFIGSGKDGYYTDYEKYINPYAHD